MGYLNVKQGNAQKESPVTISIADPHRLLLKYPAVDAAERDALVAWLRSLDARTLVSLLADSRTERRLLAIPSREPELQQGGGLWIGVGLVILMTVLVLTAALVG